MSATIGDKAITQTANENFIAVMPVVSVIIPAYNCADFIGETIDSILAQEFKDYELIVINDGSPDTEKLEKVLTPYKEKLVYLKQENTGQGGARNRGIKNARGEYIAFIDSDDLWMPNFLSEQIAYMKSNPNCDLVYADAFLFGDNSSSKKRFMECCPSEGEVNLESLLAMRCNVVMSSVVAKKQKLIDGGLFDEKHGVHSEDYEFWMRLAKFGARIEYQQKPLMRYRYRENSLSANTIKQIAGALKSLAKIEALGELSEREIAALKQTRERLLANKKLESGKQKLFNGDYKEAISDFHAADNYASNWKLKVTLLGLRVMPNLTRKIYLKLRS